MDKLIADKITKWCIKHNSVTEAQIMAISYGIELYLNTIIKISALLCIGAICGRFWETMIAIVCFCMLRGEAGGIHMQSSLGCFLSMCAMTFISVAGAAWLPEIPNKGVIFLFLAVGIVLYLYAPCTTSNNPITDSILIKRKKHRAIFIVAVLTVISVLLPDGRMRALLLLPVVIETITILPLWKRKEAGGL